MLQYWSALTQTPLSRLQRQTGANNKTHKDSQVNRERERERERERDIGSFTVHNTETNTDGLRQGGLLSF